LLCLRHSGLAQWRYLGLSSVIAFACVITMQLAYLVVTWLHVGPEPSLREPRQGRRWANHALDSYDLRMLSIDYDVRLLPLDEEGRGAGSKAVAASPSAEAIHSSNS